MCASCVQFGMHGSAILSRYYSLRLCAVIAIYIFLFTAQGICPGNRLRLLVGQYDTGGCLVGSRPDLTISEDGIQRHGKRRSWHVQPNRVSYTIPLLNSWGTEYFCIIHVSSSPFVAILLVRTKWKISWIKFLKIVDRSEINSKLNRIETRHSKCIRVARLNIRYRCLHRFTQVSILCVLNSHNIICKYYSIDRFNHRSLLYFSFSVSMFDLNLLQYYIFF